jgi:addiction module RelB/DinJ family antitoxin
MATVQVRARIDRNLKRRSDAVLAQLGLDATTYFSMALAQLSHRRGLPFAVTVSDEQYFTEEYETTSQELKRAGTAMRREIAAARRSGKLRAVSSPDDLAP